MSASPQYKFFVCILLITNVLGCFSARAQADLDSNFNIQAYTPSVLLREEQWELKVFLNLYTQTQFFEGTEQTDLNERQNFLTVINQLTLGIAPRVNVGLEMWINATHLDEKDSSPLKTYAFSNGERSRTALSYFGPRLRIAPVRKWERFSIQSTFLFPVGDQLSGNEEKPDVFVADDRYVWINQFLYDQALGSQFQVFTQLGIWWTINRDADNPRNFRRLDLPLSVFLSYFPSDRWTIFVQNEFWSRLNQNESFSYFMQPGVGVKFQLIPGMIELESSYTNFVLGKNEGAGSTFNIGARLIR